jgi:hypothetical protein
VESVVGGNLKQHVFAGGAGTLVLYIPTQVTVYCDSASLGQSLWNLGTYALSPRYSGCGQLILAYTISGSFYAALSNTYFLCTPCPAGSFSLAGAQQCTPCLVGTEQPSTGSTACAACAPGYAALTQGTPACQACPGGTYEANARTACPACGPGTFAPSGSTACISCPENTFSSGGRATCGPCPYFSVSLGGGDISGCLCQAGYLRQLNPFFVCYPCQGGTYSGINATACAQCPVGQYSSAASTACLQCAAGTYQPNPGGDHCLACQAGTLSDAGSQACQACPAPLYCQGAGQYAPCPLGTYSAATGLQSVTDCPFCPANSFCQTSGDIEACPDHTSSIPGSVSKLSCLCNPGWVCTYTRGVRVNVTLPLTTSQFALVRDQFLQAIAIAAGVDVSQVSIVGLVLLGPPGQSQNQTRRRALWDSAPYTPVDEYLLVSTHVHGIERLPAHRIKRRLRIHGLRASHTSVRQAHSVHVGKG